MLKFKTGSVSLRALELDDAPRLVELANNRNVSINLRDGFPHPYRIDDAISFINKCLLQKPTTIFGIEFDGELVGDIGLVVGTDVYSKSAEIGYFLGEPYWNKGIMTQAVNLITHYGFKRLGVVRIYTGVFEYNLSSQRVLEKCGFKKEAIFKQAIYKNESIWDEVRYAKLYDER